MQTLKEQLEFVSKELEATYRLLNERDNEIVVLRREIAYLQAKFIQIQAKYIQETK